MLHYKIACFLERKLAVFNANTSTSCRIDIVDFMVFWFGRNAQFSRIHKMFPCNFGTKSEVSTTCSIFEIDTAEL